MVRRCTGVVSIREAAGGGDTACAPAGTPASRPTRATATNLLDMHDDTSADETPFQGRSSSTWSADAFELVQANENIARLRTIGGTQHAGKVELIDDARRATVTNFQPSL